VADLHPTKTRLELLRAVKRGQVFRYDYGFGYEPSFWEQTRVDAYRWLGAVPRVPW
jgi:hypothetical protein